MLVVSYLVLQMFCGISDILPCSHKHAVAHMNEMIDSSELFWRCDQEQCVTWRRERDNLGSDILYAEPLAGFVLRGV